MTRKITVTKEHINTALEGYLKSMTMINDDETVVEVQGSGTHYWIITEKERTR